MSTAFDGINDLRNGGTLSQKLLGYTERPAQLELAQTVAEALQQHENAAIEAGTGTGKSLGYLLPIIRDGRKAVISTANKALQEQLFYKDIPFLQKHIKPFDAALVKGFNNYLCIDRLKTYQDEWLPHTERPEVDQLMTMAKDPASTWDGDFEAPGAPSVPEDLRSEIRGDRDQCAWKKCLYFHDCYIHKKNQRAQTAQIVVVNHTLLMIDAKIDGKVLPEHAVVVVDEAHRLEEEATSVFTTVVKDTSIYTLLKMKKVREAAREKLLKSIADQTENLWMKLADILKKGDAILHQSIQEGLILSTLLGDLAEELTKKVPATSGEKAVALHAKLVRRVKNLSVDLRTVFSVSDRKGYVYYLETVTSGRQTVIEAKAAPLNVSQILREKLFSPCPVICTSATLATGGDLSYFKRRAGIDKSKDRILPLVFNYQKSALLYIPRTVPTPDYSKEGEREYQIAIAQEMMRLVHASRGRAFLLFSSKRMMDRVYDEIGETLRAEYPCLCQGKGQSRAEMVKEFREQPGSVLFGLKSFWEGVDIAGEALSLVVIDKLPFPPPDDPVHQARINLLKEAGENWFMVYTIPYVELLLKQGVGRLIRSQSDRGVMAILDARMHTKPYGKAIRKSLPPAKETAQIDDVASFFSGSRVPLAPKPTRQEAQPNITVRTEVVQPTISVVLPSRSVKNGQKTASQDADRTPWKIEEKAMREVRSLYRGSRCQCGCRLKWYPGEEKCANCHTHLAWSEEGVEFIVESIQKNVAP